MFIILVNGIILSQDEAGGGRTAHRETEDVCAVREMTYAINTKFHFTSQSSCSGHGYWNERLSSKIWKRLLTALATVVDFR